MYIKKSLLLTVCCLAAYCATAQQMYKTVGPDGKVTFTDRPEVQTSAKLSVMKSYTLRDIATAPRKADSAAGPAPVRRDPAEQAVITPEVEEAMISVMGLAEFGLRFETYCDDTPADAKAFTAANYGWKKRNAAAIEQQKRLLTEVVAPAKRASLRDKQHALMAEELSKAAARSPAANKEWCSGVITELNSGRSDIDKPAMMAVPIIPYRAR
jgi:hypothetical protein